jgi:hypothetical protein
MLTICPSRGRPKILKAMVKSFNKTSHISDLVIYLDEDDPELENYETIIEHEVLIGKRKTTTEIYNQALKDYPDYDFYHLINDDVIYRTEAWDIAFRLKLIQKNGGICYGNDCLSDGVLPAFPCIDSRLARALGWLQLPALNHLYGDNVWKHIGHSLNKLFYMPEIIIEHCTWMNKKAEMDDTYKRTNNAEMYKKDYEAFHYWLHNGGRIDIERARMAL